MPSFLVKHDPISTDPLLLSLGVLSHGYTSRLRLWEDTLNVPVRAELACITLHPTLS